MKKTIFLIIITILFFASCGKKGPPVYEEKSNIIIQQS